MALIEETSVRWRTFSYSLFFPVFSFQGGDNKTGREDI